MRGQGQGPDPGDMALVTPVGTRMNMDAQKQSRLQSLLANYNRKRRGEEEETIKGPNPMVPDPVRKASTNRLQEPTRANYNKKRKSQLVDECTLKPEPVDKETISPRKCTPSVTPPVTIISSEPNDKTDRLRSMLAKYEKNRKSSNEAVENDSDEVLEEEQEIHVSPQVPSNRLREMRATYERRSNSSSPRSEIVIETETNSNNSLDLQPEEEIDPSPEDKLRSLRSQISQYESRRKSYPLVYVVEEEEEIIESNSDQEPDHQQWSSPEELHQKPHEPLENVSSGRLQTLVHNYHRNLHGTELGDGNEVQTECDNKPYPPLMSMEEKKQLHKLRIQNYIMSMRLSSQNNN